VEFKDSGELFDLDPNDFVAARDALARELKAAGDKDNAAELMKLRRPTVALWALNQVARRDASAVDELLERAEAARRAATPEALREALGRRRDAIAKVAKAARRVVDDSGRSGDAQDRDIVAALTALVGDARSDDIFRAGELTELPEGDDTIDAFAAFSTPTTAKAASPRPRKPSREVVNARAAVEQRRTAVGDAQLAVDNAQAALAIAKEDLAAAEQRLAELDQ